MKPIFTFLFFWVTVSTLLSATPFSKKTEALPNIILIMADDLGMEGLGCYCGTSYSAPRLDRMEAGGIRFRHMYSQPLCTNTRVHNLCCHFLEKYLTR